MRITGLGAVARLTIIALAVAATAVASATDSDDAPLVRRPRYIEAGTDRSWTVIDSRWGYVTRLNLALADRLDACPGDDAARQAALLRIAPNRFGRVAEEGVRLLGACNPGLTGSWRPGNPVTVGLWRAIAPDARLPSTMEKARAIGFRGAGVATDYDVAYWTADAPGEADEPLREVFIWGPSRASVVDGCFVQRVVRAMDASEAGRETLERSFAGLPGGLAALRARDCPADLAVIQGDEGLRQSFRIAVMRLGATAVGRTAYDAAYLGQGGPWAGKIASLYRIYAIAGLNPTETDFAMFLELVRGTPLPSGRADEIGRALRRAAPAGPAQARRALAGLLAPATPAVRDYALGRAVPYYIDGIGEDHLTAIELAAWQRHGRVRASDVGLGDTRYVPCDMIADLPQCPAARRTGDRR